MVQAVYPEYLWSGIVRAMRRIVVQMSCPGPTIYQNGFAFGGFKMQIQLQCIVEKARVDIDGGGIPFKIICLLTNHFLSVYPKEIL